MFFADAAVIAIVSLTYSFIILKSIWYEGVAYL